MKRIFSWILDAAVIAAVLSAAIAAEAAQPKLSELAITGPAKTAAGQQATFSVAGFTADLNKPLMDVLKAMSAVKCDVDSPDGATATVVKRAGISLDPIGVTLELTITPPKDGVYFLTADLDNATCIAAKARLTVGGTFPPDPPKPPDPPDPPPVTKTFSHCYLVYDQNDASEWIGVIRGDKSWRDEAKRQGIEVEMLTDAASEAYPNAMRQAKEFGLPCLVFFNDKQPATIEKVPQVPADLVARMKKAGGK